jgi:hypothetical protein
MMAWLKSKVLPLNTTGRCDITKMMATGIPPHIELTRKLANLEEENQKLRELLQKHHNELLEEIPKRVTGYFRETITAPQLSQMSVPELRDLYKQMLAEAKAQFGVELGLRSTAVITESEGTASQLPVGGQRLWYWKGKYRRIPVDYRFPRESTKSICDLFMFGEPVKEVPPFRNLSTKDFLREDQQYYVRAKAVFGFMTKKITEQRGFASADAVYTMTIQAWDEAFASAFTASIEQLRQTKPRLATLHPQTKSINTFYDWVKSYMTENEASGTGDVSSS